MRVVVSGSAGIGKTTLAKKLSLHLGTKYIPDFIDILLQKEGLNSPKQLDDKKSIDIRLKALDLKIIAESSNSYISDKSIVDYYAYWLIWCSKNATVTQNKQFLEKVKKYSKRYDLVIIPDFGSFKIKSNKIRETNFYYRYKIHCLIKGIYTDLNIPFKKYKFNLNTKSNKIIKDLNIK